MTTLIYANQYSGYYAVLRMNDLQKCIESFFYYLLVVGPRSSSSKTFIFCSNDFLKEEVLLSVIIIVIHLDKYEIITMMMIDDE